MRRIWNRLRAWTREPVTARFYISLMIAQTIFYIVAISTGPLWAYPLFDWIALHAR